MTYRFDVVSLFPALVETYMAESIMGRARAADLIDLTTWDPRDYADDRHRTVDDSPYGGGAGMVMKPEPLARAVEACRTARSPARVVFLGPAGRPFDQQVAREFASLGSLALVCGRYEGVDERFIEHFVDEELSLGDFILTGGEIPAMAVMDAVARLLPGVLGNAAGPEEESFTVADGLLEHPQYTRPGSWRGRDVPAVLLSGDHARVERWRAEQRLVRTRQRRPDLLEATGPSGAAADSSTEST